MRSFSVIMVAFVFVSISMSFSQDALADEAYPWDVNGDGVMDIADVILIGSHFGDSPAVEGDVNGDGVVNIADLILVGVHFGEEYETVAQEIIGKDGAPMALIPAGEFEMGDAFNEFDSDELPVHPVYVDAFYIGKYEVTNVQYAQFLNEYGKNADAAGHELLDIDDMYCPIKKVGDTYMCMPNFGYGARRDHPVVEVSWYGAAAYAQFYGKRLPTEAEWEKAARGGLPGKRYPWGDEISHDDANYSGTGGKDIWYQTSPVGSFEPNGYGLCDMAGNVWEWCADKYDSGYYSISPENNPKGPGVVATFENNDFTIINTLRVLRGGGWYHDPVNLRVVHRVYSNPPHSGNYIGFRCVSQD